jgi:uncharacterized membrane protein
VRGSAAGSGDHDESRLETRDRLRAENDFEVNVKAELLLEHLTEEIEAVKRGLLSLGARIEQNEGDSREPCPTTVVAHDRPERPDDCCDTSLSQHGPSQNS